MPAVLNAANEMAVAAFLEGKISFPDIVSVVSGTMDAIGEPPAPASLDEAEQVDRQARETASAILRRPFKHLIEAKLPANTESIWKWKKRRNNIPPRRS